MKTHVQPVRIRIKCADGVNRTYYCGYGRIKKYRDTGRLIGAWSTSTGKPVA